MGLYRTFVSAGAAALLCASCALFRGAAPQAPAASDPPPRPVSGLALPDSRSFEEMQESGYWVTRPAGGRLMIIGITGRKGSREEAVTLAKRDAARRAALFYGVRGLSATVLREGSNNLDYFTATDYEITLFHGPEEYEETLEFDPERDVLEKSGSVYIRAYLGGAPMVPAYPSALTEEGPDWAASLKAPPIPGYLTSVGLSRNRGDQQKTFAFSYENAIVRLLPQLSTTSGSAVIDMEGGKLIQNISASEGELEQVMILEAWFDAKTKSAWTLIAAKEKL